ncbi:unnamed protein product [Diplocarpon coronariae]
MQLSAPVTAATLLAIASLCTAKCEGEYKQSYGSCMIGNKLFCSAYLSTCDPGSIQSFDANLTRMNEASCADKNKDSACDRHACCT